MDKRPVEAKLQRPSGPGRLSAREREALPDRLLDAAQQVFVRHGYAGATMEAIAVTAGASRKTIYARYANKQEVLAAVLQRFLAKAVPGAPGGPSAGPRDAAGLRATLQRIGRAIAAAATAPDAVGLNRVILSEGHQFPELAQRALQLQGVAVAGVRLALEGLRDERALPGLADPQRTAQIFVEMAVSVQRRNAILGLPMSRGESDAMVDAAVEIFLNGTARDGDPAREALP